MTIILLLKEIEHDHLLPALDALQDPNPNPKIVMQPLIAVWIGDHQSLRTSNEEGQACHPLHVHPQGLVGTCV